MHSIQFPAGARQIRYHTPDPDTRAILIHRFADSNSLGKINRLLIELINYLLAR